MERVTAVAEVIERRMADWLIDRALVTAVLESRGGAGGDGTLLSVEEMDAVAAAEMMHAQRSPMRGQQRTKPYCCVTARRVSSINVDEWRRWRC